MQTREELMHQIESLQNRIAVLEARLETGRDEPPPAAREAGGGFGRRNGEGASTESDDRLLLLKEAVEALPIGITITDRQGKIIYTNPSERRIHGCRREEDLLGKHARVLAPPASWQPMAFEQMHALGVWKRQTVNVRKNGEIFPVQLTSIAVRNAAGEPIGIVTACEDITARRRAEEKLILRQRALHAVYRMATTPGRSFKSLCDEVVLNISWLLDVSHVLVMRNDRHVVTFVSGIADGSLLAGNVDCPGGCSDLSAREHGLSIGPLRDDCPGRSFPENDLAHLYSIPITSTAGEKVGLIDIVDRGHCELTEDDLRLVEIFARYIAFVIEADRMEQQLRNAQRMELVGQLAAGVAHEVRNPLNALLAISDALSRELGDNEEYQQFLNHIRTQVERLSVLMKDLLDLGKPVEKIHLRDEPLEEICSSAVDIWMRSGVKRSHTIGLAKPSASRTVIVAADSRRLQQVFLNLFENAAQHSPAGSAIQVAMHAPEEGVCRVEVTDRGSGIPEEFLSRIFEPFFSTRRGGTGLGMSIVKHIIEAHGGTVAVENNHLMPGCTIRIRLPVKEK